MVFVFVYLPIQQNCKMLSEIMVTQHADGALRKLVVSSINSVSVNR
jgi:hypothetical protein